MGVTSYKLNMPYILVLTAILTGSRQKNLLCLYGDDPMSNNFR